MGVRGRKSAASQQVVIAGNFGERPEPPTDLTGEQAEVWRATVASEAAAFFKTETARSMLADYCRHAVTTAGLSRQIDAVDVPSIEDEDGLKRYDLLLKMRDRESKAKAAKATKLRLTNQSRYDEKVASTTAKNSGSTRPWDIAANG